MIETKLYKISDIKPNPNNPRIIKDDKFLKLVNSIKEFPEMLKIRPIVINEDNIVLGGNMRLKACKEAKLKEIPVIMASDLTEAQQREFIIKDNIGFGDWDFQDLAQNWNAEELETWGLDLPELEINNLEAVEDDFEVPENGIETDIVLGDLFEIGEHRLMCGDSTDSDSVAKLIENNKIDMVFTDPPYGINWNTDYTRFKGGERTGVKYDKIQNDKKDFDPSFFLAMFDKCFFFGANCFSDKLPLGNWIVWDKRYKNGVSFLADAEVGWYNGSGAVYIVEEVNQGFVNSDQKKFHPTQKPIKLIEKIFEKINIPKTLFDPFIGSGSTMIAAHQLKRKCFGMELDPKYCQVIIDRMKKLEPEIVIKRNGIVI